MIINKWTNVIYIMIYKLSLCIPLLLHGVLYQYEEDAGVRNFPRCSEIIHVISLQVHENLTVASSTILVESCK